MLSLRCVRWVAWPLLLSGVVACSNGRGSVDDEDPPPTQGAQDGFTLGGSVNGLVGSGLVLQNNGAGDLPIAADGSFTFPSRLATGTAYSVAVRTQPTAPSQTCTVARGSGSIGSANVADVAISCATGQFSIRGTNLSDEIGLTESNSRIFGTAAGAGGVLLARPLEGREITFQAMYRF